MIKIAIFASGGGSNALKIIDYFALRSDISFVILSNKSDAPILEKATAKDIENIVFNRKEFYESHRILEYLQKNEVDLIVLAGFLWLMPRYLIENYADKIINIHPALLPKYGGKGMFGINVHTAVKNAKETETGITIHFVNENYDEGMIILQKKCVIQEIDTPEMIAKKVLALEHEWLPQIVEKLIDSFA